jgi:predicted GIY-YIG superfamily endonuclease
MNTGFFYVYILRSEADPPHFYTGFTENLEARPAHHDSGRDPRPAKYRPWRIVTAIALTDRGQAVAYARYLKAPAGRHSPRSGCSLRNLAEHCGH